jgi:hypothetical protein
MGSADDPAQQLGPQQSVERTPLKLQTWYLLDVHQQMLMR